MQASVPLSPRGCVGNAAFEKAVDSAKRDYDTVIIVKHFNLACASCSARTVPICVIATDLSYDDVILVHGVSLQRSFHLMKDCTDDEYLLEPLNKSVRYFDASTPHSVREYANKLSVVFNALAYSYPNGSTVRLLCKGGLPVQWC